MIVWYIHSTPANGREMNMGSQMLIGGLIIVYVALVVYLQTKWHFCKKIRKQILDEWRNSILAGDAHYEVRINDYIRVHNRYMHMFGVNMLPLEPFIVSKDEDIINAMHERAKYYEEKGHSKTCEKIVLPFEDAICSCGYDNAVQPFRHKP